MGRAARREPGRRRRLPQRGELGAQTHTAVSRQLPTALALLRHAPGPTIAAAVIGANDTLRGSFDVNRTGRAMHEVVHALHQTGAVVLTCGLHPASAGTGCWPAPSAPSCARGLDVRELDPEPTNPPPTRLASLRWLATKGTKWVLDRSTDLVPNLIGLSMVEFWHGMRGLTARLDQRITADIRSTIEAIEGGPDAQLEIAAA